MALTATSSALGGTTTRSRSMTATRSARGCSLRSPRRPACDQRISKSVPNYEDELAQIVAQLNRAAPTSRALRPETGQSTATLDQLLAYAIRCSASDVLLIVGAPVILRVNGALTPVTGPVLSSEDTRNLLLPLLATTQYEE